MKPLVEIRGRSPDSVRAGALRRSDLSLAERTESMYLHITATYAARKGIVEPVIGQIKHARGFRQFLLRGFEQVQGEWSLVCTTHNMLKLYRLCG